MVYSTDMWEPFINAAKTYFPNAKHCHDMYHCVSYLNVAFMFKRHLKGISRAWVTKANNGKAERMNGSIQEINTIGRGYAMAKRFRTAILFFHGKLDLY